MRLRFQALLVALTASLAIFAFSPKAHAAPGDEEDPDIEIEPEDEGDTAGEGEGEGEGDGDVDIEIEPEEAQGDLESDQAALENGGGEGALKTEGQLGEYRVSWQDIVTVIRKPFLKVRRWELEPLFGTTMNDNMVRHYSSGAEINYYLTDVLAVGVEGQYFTKSFREPFDLVARQARRLPTINKYNFAAGVNFHYVPVYGKFALLDKKIVTWEAFFTAGLGITQSEVVPRDPRFEGFTNILITPNVGASMRFFLFKWLTVSAGVRDYLFVDKFEPVGRSDSMFPTASEAKDHADSAFINNVMFQLGVSFWLPPTFEYTTFR